MAKLVLSSGGCVLNNYFIDKPRVVIGRDRRSDVVIDDPCVGDEHATIITVGEDFIINGLDSSYGTFVNGRRISRHILQHRDVIEFGAFNLCYMNSKAAQENDLDRTMIIAALPRQGDAAASAIPPDGRSVLAPRAANVRFPNGRLKRLFGAGVPALTELNRVVTLVGVAGVAQAVVTRRPHGYFLTHVDGRQRARINSMPIGEGPRPLRSGDVIEAAGQQFEFLADPAAELGEIRASGEIERRALAS